MADTPAAILDLDAVDGWAQDPGSLVRALVNRFKGPGQYHDPRNGWWPRKEDIGTALSIAVLCHLKHPPNIAVEVGRFVNDGFDVAIDYFLGDWWKTDKEMRPFVDKDSAKFDARWFDPFYEGLMLGLLTARWSDVARLCGWMEPRVWLFRDKPCSDQLYLSIASSLRPEPMPTLDLIEAGVERTRDKRLKLWFEAWFAGRAGNQGAFDKKIKEVLVHHERNYAKDAEDGVCSAVAIIPSTIVLVAMRLGLNFPEGLSERQRALLVSRESLGLSPETK